MLLGLLQDLIEVCSWLDVLTSEMASCYLAAYLKLCNQIRVKICAF